MLNIINKWALNAQKLNSFELTKLDTDGLDILDKLNYFQKASFTSISNEERDLLKWAGIYIQRPRSDGYFMMRVKIPFGVMISTQARVLASISKDYGRDILDITTRQSIQFHWLRIEDIPSIQSKLASVNLSSVEACGDCPRNIIGNPLAGIDPHEILDTRKIQNEVYNFFQGNRDFSNLPRKFKVSISANIFDTGHAAINDLAFTPASKLIDNEIVQGFHVYVGGGLSAKPHLAKKLDIFLKPDEVLKVTIGVASLFRDFGYRQSRQHARLKFLVADWGAMKFKQELEKLVGPLLSGGDDLICGWNAGYFNGIHQQKQPGLHYFGLSVPLGRLSADNLKDLADITDKYGDGTIRITNSQNIILAGISDNRVMSFLHEPLLHVLTPFPETFKAHTISCTGKDFCNLAIVETKKYARQISQYLDNTLKLDTPIRIHITGCPNSCGQVQLADIGLRGAKSKKTSQTIEGFELQIGGVLGPEPQIGTSLKGFIPADIAHVVIEQLIRFYKDHRIDHESFNTFINRNGTEEFQSILNNFLDRIFVPTESRYGLT
ncbi:sulfite reductase [ferredoxin] [Desulfosporosinus acididurans]|uniref:Sulfite reductase [ferredoxin] n=1 Tax=Desulfosporosinus acididurans TaxID=476652 RepID=A0A0J1FLY8_9FIRM|nr:ferredoxin--nitrite reductase [Desulfosporosinus acididurans]KLU63968.1 sulfite reductase [ferredoxin] [Desulfosporosinus acididurans]